MLQFELLQNIPGDVDKNFTVYAQILDNDEFGDVFQKQTVNWGTFNKLNTPDKNKKAQPANLCIGPMTKEIPSANSARQKTRH